MCVYLFKVLVLMDDKMHGGMRSSFTGERKEKRNTHFFILLRSPYTTTNSTYFNSIFLSFFMNTDKGGR
jgi:hypothetical protein